MSGKIFFTLSFAFIIASCTQQRMAFRFADTAASWRADDYFDLNSAQKTQVEKQLKVFLHEAYENNDREIPKLFDKADQLLANVNDQNKLDCKAADKIREDAGTLFANIPALSASHIKTLTDSLSEKQIKYFIDKVAQDIKEDEQKLKKPDDLHDRRLKRTLDNLKVFLGNLTSQQENAVRAHMKANPFPFAERLKNKKANYEKTKQLGDNPEAFKNFIVDFVQSWRNYQSAEYLKLSDEQRLQNEKFYQQLICDSSTQQLHFLRKKLSDIKKDFEEFFVPARGN
ncbi:DUF6279 family lipoprotein [Pseudobdellovibrio exovorus]|uniref:Lipoprotein n=1 Tax=Pseudobdellovibrio exovorus JSS TaxID=1184267 RepID=M4V8W3_9BACT|nr:DUF6279 family lipoprotein [Pseudobdellovibrio exovorus]AGH94456.1 hypothetical protein A11Q_236 [Pseudobdellovibrio exovorus JSS]